MTKPDQNRVNLGPARIKVEDSIYDAVDQGIVGTTNVVTTPVEPDGFVPIGPIGDLITPPVLAPVTGYPIYATDIAFESGPTYPSPSFYDTTPWNILDTSAIGGFSNSLVVSNVNELYYVNLDNPSQLVTFVNKGRAARPDFVLREGILTSGWSSLVGGVWVVEDVDITINGVTQTVTGSIIDNNIIFGVRDNLYTYFTLGQGWNSGSGNIMAWGKVPHSGPLTLEVVAYGKPVGWPSFTSSGSVVLYSGTVRSVRENIMWISMYSNPGGFSPLFQVAAINLLTNEMTPAYNFSSVYSNGPWFSITGGFAAWLGSRTTVGPNYVYKLHIVGVDGSLATQANFITIPVSSGGFFDSAGSVGWNVEIPETDTVLARNVTAPHTLYQISAAGYQVISGTPPYMDQLRIGPAAIGALRFYGATSSNNDNPALYQVTL
jgi:hypothetical protein